MSNKYMKICPTSLIKETQIKSMLRYHYTPIRRAKIKKKVATENDDKDATKLDDLHPAGANVGHQRSLEQCVHTFF